MSDDGYDISTESKESESANDIDSNLSVLSHQFEITAEKNTWIQTAILILADDVGLGITT